MTAAADMQASPAQRAGVRVADLVEIMKPGIVTMSVLTAAGGYYLGATGPFALVPFLHAMLASTMLAGGACALNMYLEREVDGLMERTKNRPLPAGRLSPTAAFIWGALVSVAGLLYLAFGVNLVAGAVGALALGSYVLVYTPMKRVTSLSTLVGALPGALPPVMGWAAASGRIEYGALILFLIMFLWQLPHSLAIYYMYKDDYARAGMPLLPVLDPTGLSTVRQAVVWALALALAGLLPSIARVAGIFYFGAALLLGLWFLWLCLQWYARPLERPVARRVFFGSLVYLTALIGALVVDKMFF